MKRTTPLRALSAAIFFAAFAPSVGTAQTAAPTKASKSAIPIVVIDIDPKGGPLRDQLVSEIAKARAAGLTPFVEIGAVWCGPCQKLKKAIHAGDSLMADAFKGTAILRLDQDAWKDSLEPLAFVNGGIPVFFAVDSTGKASGAKIDGGAWGEDIPANMAPPLKAFFRKHLDPSLGGK